MTTIPDLAVAPAAPPLFHRTGAAQVNYRPGAEEGLLTFVLEGWPHPVRCTEREWLELVAAVSSVLTDPLAESRRVAARVAAMGENGGGRGGA